MPVSTVPVPTLHRPDTILNDLARGDFHTGNITFIHTENSASVRREWKFEVEKNSNRVKNLSMVKPPYLCERTNITFKYNSENFIEEIISIRSDSCAKISSKWVYKYNYEDKLLVSITGTNYFSSATANNLTLSRCENYFSYYPNGKVLKIYSRLWDPDNIQVGFQTKSLKYDSSGNVAEVTREEYSTSEYDQKYTFEYDDKLNPLKGLYIISSIQSELWGYGYASSLGPRYLSKNCIKSIKTEYLHNSNPAHIEYFDSNVVNGKVIDFGYRTSSTDWMRFFIKY